MVPQLKSETPYDPKDFKSTFQGLEGFSSSNLSLAEDLGGTGFVIKGCLPDNINVMGFFLISLILIKPVIVTSLPPLTAMANFIGGDNFQYKSLLSGGENPHTYEIKPSDLYAVSHSDLFIAVGAGPDSWVKSLFSSAPNALNLQDSLKMKGLKIRDPHIWIQPSLLPICFTEIAKALGKLCPEKSDSFRGKAKYASFKLDSLLSHYLGSESHRGSLRVIVNHPLWISLLKRLSIEAVDTIFPTATSDISLLRYRRLIRKGKKVKVKMIISESNFPVKTPGTLAKEINAKLVVLNPLFDGDFFLEFDKNLKKIMQEDGRN